MTLGTAAKIAWLWNTREWNTADIAEALGVPEPEVVKVLDILRSRERGPELRVVS
jgi:DNA-binding transcriptional regulator LsrR (DeoR family)